MILFVPIGLLILSNLYFGAQHLSLYQRGKINTTRRFSLKIINGVLAGDIDEQERKKLTTVKRLYIVYLILFYATIACAAIEVYIAAITRK